MFTLEMKLCEMLSSPVTSISDALILANSVNFAPTVPVNKLTCHCRHFELTQSHVAEMAFRGTLLWLWTLKVLFSGTIQDERMPLNCSSKAEFTQLSDQLERAAECGDVLTSEWSVQQTAAVLNSVNQLTETLHKRQLKDCQGAAPNECPDAEVHENGGLVCVTVNDKRLCKPLCNYGYDFSFIRLSRLYDECSKDTGFQWRSQFIGGNKLAVCNEDRALNPVAGARSAYFPIDQDCLTTKSNGTLQSLVLEEFLTELKGQGIQDKANFTCLVCGRPH